ncbi:hypothetical protein PuT2_14170 [Pusillimonas sp. T2]|uniref:hypothetical protein n=1 Tax=Pusillimonas sp. T2 TaxID=1548123 RepID=UPI000B9CC16D|nr:hypothetical protein [Pusillimonas sp. T2]OXR48165.1 hypothetical protein PuT2_14170 [Pusillimonas sp. T2]
MTTQKFQEPHDDGSKVQTSRAQWLAGLFPDDKMFAQIKAIATESFNAQAQEQCARKPSLAENWEAHLIWATKRWVEQNAPAEQTPGPVANDDTHTAQAQSLDLEALKAAAIAAGAGHWSHQEGIVWFNDGAAALTSDPANAKPPVFLASDNLGTWPDSIAREDVAAFAALANPTNVLALVHRLQRLEAAARDILHSTELARWSEPRESVPADRMAKVRFHALADLHDLVVI